jgi:hypothetical protein
MRIEKLEKGVYSTPLKYFPGKKRRKWGRCWWKSGGKGKFLYRKQNHNISMLMGKSSEEGKLVDVGGGRNCWSDNLE